MPGELLVKMEPAAGLVSRSKLLRPAASTTPDTYLISDEDTVYEQDILRDPSSIKPWLSYIDFKLQYGSVLEQAYVLERACTELPRSYKLWKMYLEYRIKHLGKLSFTSDPAEFHKVNALFASALILLNKMPRIWELFLSFLMCQPVVTFARRVFDSALRALPVSQHHRIWALYLKFAKAASGKTAISIWRRYVQVHPEESERYIEILINAKHFTDAVKAYIDILNNPRFKSKEGKSVYQLWMDMVDLMVTRARDIDTSPDTGVDVAKIIKSGIDRFADQRGKLWASLATYWVVRGSFERSRDVFEEAITNAMTVRDFTLAFDSYAEFEESIIGKLLDKASTGSAKGTAAEAADFDLDIRMKRFEQLMDRRPFLLNDVLLRQDPNNVAEWEKRVGLWGNNKEEIVNTYTDAIVAIHPKRAVGKLVDLWLNYAKFYEAGEDLETARTIFEKAVKVPFKTVDELAHVWCEWASMELRSNFFDKAVQLLAKATEAPKRSTVDYNDDTLTPQKRLHKSSRLWSAYVDLVESTKGLADTCQVYARIFQLKIATPHNVVNYAKLLEEHSFFDKSFRVYEQGLRLFKYPVAFEIWNLYLSKAVEQKMDLERLRDLFEQALDDCPPKLAKTLYMLYAQVEETRGLARHAMRIWDRATQRVAEEDRMEIYEAYITKSASNFGLVSTRQIYEQAIHELPEDQARDMALRFAQMERCLGEVDRARSIYGFASQFCDPRTTPQFWSKFEAFEVKHGNEDTYKEMLRIKRSVQAKYNTDVKFVASQAVTRAKDA